MAWPRRTAPPRRRGSPFAPRHAASSVAPRVRGGPESARRWLSPVDGLRRSGRPAARNSARRPVATVPRLPCDTLAASAKHDGRAPAASASPIRGEAAPHTVGPRAVLTIRARIRLLATRAPTSGRAEAALAARSKFDAAWFLARVVDLTLAVLAGGLPITRGRKDDPKCEYRFLPFGGRGDAGASDRVGGKRQAQL